MTISSTLNRYLYLNGLDTVSVLDAEWPDGETLDRLDGLTVGELISQVGGSDDFIRLLDAHGATFTSVSSALGCVPDLAYHFGDQNLFRIEGGNEQLPQAMARELRDRIVLGAPVTAIDQSAARVRVSVADGCEFSGDAIVCTIPFTVLQDIKVTPAWSPRKSEMFQRFT